MTDAAGLSHARALLDGRCSVKETSKPVRRQNLGSLKVKLLPREGVCVLIVELTGCRITLRRNGCRALGNTEPGSGELGGNRRAHQPLSTLQS